MDHSKRWDRHLRQSYNPGLRQNVSPGKRLHSKLRRLCLAQMLRQIGLRPKVRVRMVAGVAASSPPFSGGRNSR